VDKSYPLKPAWTDLVKINYGAGAESLPFADDGAGAFTRVNAWVKENTAGRITDLFPPGTSSSLTRLVLVDAVYFNVPWETPFDRNMTRLGPFFAAKGDTRQTPLMVTQRYLAYERRAGYQVVAIPYAVKDLQFLAMIPDNREGLKDFIARLTPELFTGCTRMKSSLISLTIPRVQLKPPPVSLKEPLRAMGLSKALSVLEADFSLISQGKPRLFISEVRQSAWLLMDEKGTEAAAATQLSAEPFGEDPSPPKPILVRADRPFLFAIQHIPTATCLFLGCVTNPAGFVHSEGK
jgi:serpin B